MVALLVACVTLPTAVSEVPSQPVVPVISEAPATSIPELTTTTAPTTTTTVSPYARPEWLGTRILPLRPDGEFGEVQPTPPELIDRHLETIDVLPAPAGEVFDWSIGSVPPQVAARSSWTADCPVTLDELAYVTVSHYGFDGRFHTGELVVNLSVAEGLVEVFRQLHEARFPLEQVRVIRKEEIDAPPTGDWNDTTSFVCRPAVGSQNWSQHAYGLAVDVNPFHNPYLKGDLVLPELASIYTNRDDIRDGMIVPGDVVVSAFAEMGWPWGGNWRSLKDWMHFSQSGG
jgi:hypothetical protein